MFRKLKSLITAMLVTAILPTLRIPENDNTPGSPPEPPEISPSPSNSSPTRGEESGKERTSPTRGEESMKERTSPTRGEESGIKEKIKDLEGLLAGKETELNQAKAKIEGLENTASETAARLSELDGSLKKTVASYKALILQSNPEILPELISGDSLETLDISLSKAKELTEKIKGKLKAQSLMLKVPAGAPPRGREDTSGLSASEKIRRGLSNK